MDTGIDAATDSGVDGRWLTYAELAELRHIDKPSALKLALRRKWPRRKDNHGRMQVCVPAEWLADRDKSMHGDMDTSTDMSRAISALEGSVTALREQLEQVQKRADQSEIRAERAESRAHELRERLEVLQGELQQTTQRAQQAENEAEAAKIGQAEALADVAELRQAEAARLASGRLARAWRAWRGE